MNTIMRITIVLVTVPAVMLILAFAFVLSAVKCGTDAIDRMINRALDECL